MRVKTSSLYCMLALLLICSYGTVKAAPSLEDQKKALDIIADFSDRICDQIPLEGSGASIELNGEGKAALNGLLKKVTNLGIEGAAKYQDEKWTNVFQKDIANVLKESRNCKLELFKELKDEIIPKQQDVSSAHSTTSIDQINTGSGTAIGKADDITINNN